MPPATTIAQRHGGGLSDALQTVIHAFRIEESLCGTKHSEVSARTDRTTPALAWDRRPVPLPAPPQKEGNQNVHSPDSRECGNPGYTWVWSTALDSGSRFAWPE